MGDHHAYRALRVVHPGCPGCGDSSAGRHARPAPRTRRARLVGDDRAGRAYHACLADRVGLAGLVGRVGRVDLDSRGHPADRYRADSHTVGHHALAGVAPAPGCRCRHYMDLAVPAVPVAPDHRARRAGRDFAAAAAHEARAAADAARGSALVVAAAAAGRHGFLRDDMAYCPVPGRRAARGSGVAAAVVAASRWSRGHHWYAHRDAAPDSPRP